MHMSFLLSLILYGNKKVCMCPIKGSVRWLVLDETTQ